MRDLECNSVTDSGIDKWRRRLHAAFELQDDSFNIHCHIN